MFAYTLICAKIQRISKKRRIKKQKKSIVAYIPFRAHADAKPISPPHILYPELADMYPKLMDMYPKLADTYSKPLNKENPAAKALKNANG